MIKIAALLKEFQLKVSRRRLHHIISEPTHILENSSLSIDLNFTLQPNLSFESELSLHSTLTVIVRLFTPNLVLKSFTHHFTPAKFGTTKIQMLILSDDSLINLTGIEPLRVIM